MSTNWVDQEAKQAKHHQAEVAAKRAAQSSHESEQTEKTLHHLAGRVEELRARLERVLIPVSATGSGAALQGNGPAEPISPLTGRLRSFRGLAQSSIDIVEDILNRLDV